MDILRVKITGNTYPVRDQIRGLGGRWDAATKSWRVPADRAVEAQALVLAAPAPASVVAGPVVAVTGNTYPVREQIRALGGRWDAATKSWLVPADKAVEAQALVPAKAKRAARTAYNPDRFNGYGTRRGGRSRACRTDGNCSSVGSGLSCGAHDCDGF